MIRQTRILDSDGKPFSIEEKKHVDLLASGRGYDLLRRRYQSDQWENATRTSADALNTRGTRQNLIDLCRYEVANNPHLHGLLIKIANEIVGTGPKLSIEPKNPSPAKLTSAARVERLWNEWENETDFVGKLRTMCIERPTAGEVFGNVFANRGLETVPVDFQVYEPEQWQNPWRDMQTMVNDEVDGIRYDQYGNPLSYCRLDHHPYSNWQDWGGTSGATSLSDFEWVDASIVFHWFQKTRPSMHRGVPEIAPTLEVYGRLRRFIESKVIQEELRAKLMGVVKTAFAPDAGCADLGDDPIDMLIGDGQFTTMPDGWDVTTFKFDATNQGVLEFVRTSLMWATQALLAPWNIVSGDSSDYNFASGRLDHQQFYRYVDVVQAHLERHLLCWFFDNFWWPVARTLPGMSAGLSDFNCVWYWPERKPIDENKRAQALSTLKEAGLLDTVKYFAELGENAMDSSMRQIDFELASEKYRLDKRAEMGLPEEMNNEPQETTTEEPAV